MEEVAFSDLMRNQREVTEQAVHGRGVRLRRRGNDEDLFLVSASRMELAEQGFKFVARIFASLVKIGDGAEVLADAIPEVFPWTHFLGDEEVREFTSELVRTFDACSDLENLTPVAVVVGAWKATAEAYADPELYARLTQSDIRDAGAVSPG